MADAPKMANLTVDGRTLSVPAGTLLIEACRSANIEVPSFCYYPNLSLQAACRMCIVEIEKMPKLQTACTVVVADGMVVHTTSETVARARKSAIEFILTNHPLDCPVCDAGGECELQDMTFRYGAAESRFTEPKRHRDEQQWSPVVYFDRPRCILCYRCVRVCGEGMDVFALGVANRGVASTIIPNRQDHLECEECGMCIDICPVGALTSGAYRYKTRPWEMKHVGAICTFCGDGCKTTLGVRNDLVIRADNRDKSGINGDFLCIKGRYAFDAINHPERLRQPHVRRDGALKPVSWTFALETIARRWKDIRAAGGSFGVIGSTRTLNEENYQLQRLARTVLGTNNIDHRRSADFPALYDALADSSGPLPLADSAALKTATAVLLVGGDPTEEHPLLAWNLRWGYRLNATRLYIINSRPIKLRRQAVRTAVVHDGGEAQAIRFLNGKAPAPRCDVLATFGVDVKRWPQTPVTHPEPVSETLENVREMLQKESDVVIVFGPEIRGDDIRELVQFGRSLAGNTRFIALADNSNSHGAADMGLYPDLLPGYVSVADADARGRFERLWNAEIPSQPGLDTDKMLRAAQNGSLQGLYVVGANPLRGAGSSPDFTKTFLVVQDMFLTETARLADVVLPALSAYEKFGTLTNTCGEVQNQRRGGSFEGAQSDLEIIHRLAALLDRPFGPADPDRVFNEIRANVKGYNVSLVQILSGRSALTAPLNGRVPAASAPGLIRPNHDTLFTAGTMGRYSTTLNTVLERRRGTAQGEEKKTV